jgi:hypothetical protein
MQVDVRARFVGWQGPAVEAPELEQVGIARGIADRGQAHLDQRTGCRRRGIGRGRSHQIHVALSPARRRGAVAA